MSPDCLMELGPTLASIQNPADEIVPPLNWCETVARWCIPTPALTINALIVKRNIRRLSEYASHFGLRVRPHLKTHKMRCIASLQSAADAIGFTVAKISEAETLTSANDNVLVAYPPVGNARSKRLALLARDRTVCAAVDSVESIRMVGTAARSARTTIGLLVEIDVGMRRTGVQNADESLALAQLIDLEKGVRLDGIMVYPGHIWELPDQQAHALSAVDLILEHTIDLWTQHGLSASIVSGGSTPTAYQSHFNRRLTEIRPGTYVFNDMNIVRGGYCDELDCAARVVATVVSTAVPGQVVVDAGSKTLSSDLCLPARESGYGLIAEYPAARITRLSEEHGQIDMTACERLPQVGELVSIIPNHICPCINLQNNVWWMAQNEPPRRLTIDARGMLE